MKNGFWGAVIFLLLFSLSGTGCAQPLQKKGQAMSDFAAHWKQVEEFTRKGLPRSALEVVEQIYAESKKTGNDAQTIKALLKKTELIGAFAEDALLANIEMVEAEITGSRFPVKPVLESVLAELYWAFYQQNRWKILERTPVSEPAESDISVWDAAAFVQKTVTLYRASLAEKERLKQMPLDGLDPVLQKEAGSRRYRPTLFDLLAHRALDFFMSDEPGITRPAAQFHLRGELPFAPAAEFAKAQFANDDTLSFQYQALLIFQELLDFHLRDDAPEARVDVDLKRLDFARQHSVDPQKEELYRRALQDLEQHYQQFAISTWIAFKIAQFYNERSENYQRLAPAEGLNATYKTDRKRALEVCEAALQRFPQSEGAANCRALKAQISQKSLSLSVEKITPPGAPFRGLVKFRNVPKVFVKIVSLDPELLQKERTEKRYNFDQWMRFYLGQPEMAAFAVELPEEGDFHEHAVEIKFPALKPGYYMVLLGTAPDFSRQGEAVGTADVWISNLSFVEKRKLASTRDGGETGFYVFDRTSGQPLPGVTAQLWISSYDTQKRRNIETPGKQYLTDENGYFRVEPTEGRRSSFKLDLRYQNDRLFPDDFQNLYHYPRRRETPTQTRTFFFTDRTIYRPGQTLFFKGLMLQSDGKNNEILPDQPSTVTLLDANGQKVAELPLQTNEFGTFWGSFTLPSAGLPGMMRIRNESGTAAFSVEEYKRPRFEVVFDPVKGGFKLGEKVTVSGKAAAFSGTNIDNAPVRFRVTRQAHFPYEWDSWRILPFFSQPLEVANGLLRTAEDGTFSVEFAAVDDPTIPADQKTIFTFTVAVDVTDVGGETHSAQTAVQVGRVALAVELNLPEEINREKAPEIAIDSKNLNGEFEPASGEIVIYPLKDPGRILRERLWERPDLFLMDQTTYVAAFPNDVYAGEDDFRNWERGEAVFTYHFNTAEQKRFSLENIAGWAQGKYVAEVTTADRFGTAVQLTKFFTLYSLEDRSVPNHALSWYAPFVTAGEPGEVAQVYWGSAAGPVHAFLEIFRPDREVESRRVQAGNQKNHLLFPLGEMDRGGFSFSLFFVKLGRVHTIADVIEVPWSNKELKITYETFRDNLKPGEKEEWRLKISGPGGGGERVAAEMLAAMYDASLDAFRPHRWLFDIYPVVTQPARSYWNSRTAFGTNTVRASGVNWNPDVNFAFHRYDRLDWNVPYGRRVYSLQREAFESAAPMQAPDGGQGQEEEGILAMSADEKQQVPPSGPASGSPGQEVQIRANLNETAFFFPDLRTDAEGNIIFRFTMPEALTRWKFMGFAHTKDLVYALTERTVVTQKELMVTPNAPRFFREGDEIEFSGKVANLTEQELSGSATLQLFDALSMQPVDADFGHRGEPLPFTVKAGQSAPLRWQLQVPAGISAVTYRIIVRTPQFSDGEENTLPVLTNRMLVTETLPMPIRGKQRKTFALDKLVQAGKSKTLRHQRLTLEFTSNPAWYAVQALPYLMEFPYECSEQIFSRYYANSLAAHIANSQPKIKRVFAQWRTAQPAALLSNLEKNQELKNLLLEETPWVLQARDESDRKKRIALLFDLNKMAYEQQNALRKLQQMQNPNGAWPWFPGLRDNRYITTHIVAGLGHLARLGVSDAAETGAAAQMIRLALQYLDEQAAADYQKLREHKTDLAAQNIGPAQIQYLYARSFFMKEPLAEAHQTAFAYWKNQAAKYWLPQGPYLQGMIALALHRLDDAQTPRDIIASLREHALTSEEFGMYWRKDPGFYWYEAPIETQALMIELFDEVANDPRVVNEMRIWLLKQKQTRDWKTTKATSEACYALLLRGSDFLAEDRQVTVQVGNKKIDPAKMPDLAAEAGTGYFQVDWRGSEINPDMGQVIVEKATEGVAWGALYWQYFEQLDQITPHQTPLKLQKALFLQQDTPSGPVLKPLSAATGLQPGDLVKVRIELRVDRDMEYVHMKDMRAAGFEPLNVFSQAKWQGGLGYYESTRDAATHFFFDYLPRGTYVFEYPLRVTHNGNFSNGITQIQSMYAPEFSAHSGGIRVVIGN